MSMLDGDTPTMTATKEILDLNRFDDRAARTFEPELADRIRRRRATFGASSVLFYEQPIEMVRARGAFMYDASGKRYLDVYNNVPSVGHCHPKVVEAIAAQAAVLNIHTRYLNRAVEAYAEALLATFPAPLTNLVMTCTGSESNDLAMRIAQIGTGKRGFIVTETAYHGNTALVTEISPSSLRKRAPADFVRCVPAPLLRPGEDVAATFAAAVRSAAADLEAAGHGVAALIVDSIFSSDGIHADPAGFLKQAVEAVHGAGGLFIADEVQRGSGAPAVECGGSNATASRRTSSPWASRWATAFRRAASSPGRTCSPPSARRPAISTPSAATRLPPPPARRCST